MSSKPTLGQLDLFGSPHERSLTAENAWLQQRLETAKGEFRKLRQERDAVACACGELELRVGALQAEIGRHLRALDQAQRDARYWQKLCELERMVRSMAPTGAHTLKQLQRLAHPDRWSQGQPATALAHELSCVINAALTAGKGQP